MDNGRLRSTAVKEDEKIYYLSETVLSKTIFRMLAHHVTGVDEVTS